jgi:hypothetical protein
MTHPDAIGGSYPERLAVHRATGQPKAVRAAQAWHKAHKKKKCQCGTCKICQQRARRIEQKAKDEARIAGVVAADPATPKVKLSTSPEIAFLDRLLASKWKGVPSALLPPCVVAALQAWQEPPEPSTAITDAVKLWERINIPDPVADWADDWLKADYARRLANAERDMGAKRQRLAAAIEKWMEAWGIRASCHHAMQRIQADPAYQASEDGIHLSMACQPLAPQ